MNNKISLNNKEKILKYTIQLSISLNVFSWLVL